MAQVNFSADARQALTDAVKEGEKSEGKWVAAADLMYADGIRADMLHKDGEVEIFEAAKSCIVAGLKAEYRTLILADLAVLTAGLSDDARKIKVAERKTAQQKIGKYMADIKMYLKRFEDTSGKEVSKKTELQMIHEAIDRAVTKLQKLEGSHKFDIAATISKLNATKLTIPLQ